MNINKDNKLNKYDYKTSLCKEYSEDNNCKSGENCDFAHGKHELRCIFDETCNKGKECYKIHPKRDDIENKEYKHKYDKLDKERYLSKLEKKLKDWSLTDKEYEEIENEIKKLREEQYNINKTKTEIMIDKYNKDDNEYESDIINEIPKVTVNLTFSDENDKNDDIKCLIKEMEDQINCYKVKDNIIKMNINDKIKLKLMSQIDDIELCIIKFKKNYENYTKIGIIKR